MELRQDIPHRRKKSRVFNVRLLHLHLRTVTNHLHCHSQPNRQIQQNHHPQPITKAQRHLPRLKQKKRLQPLVRHHPKSCQRPLIKDENSITINVRKQSQKLPAGQEIAQPPSDHLGEGIPRLLMFVFLFVLARSLLKNISILIYNHFIY